MICDKRMMFIYLVIVRVYCIIGQPGLCVKASKTQIHAQHSYRVVYEMREALDMCDMKKKCV